MLVPLQCFGARPVRSWGSWGPNVVNEQKGSKKKNSRSAESAAVFARISLEIGNELVQRVLHVHMPDFDPDLVLVGQDGFLFFLLPLLVDKRMPAKSVLRSVIVAEERRRNRAAYR